MNKELGVLLAGLELQLSAPQDLLERVQEELGIWLPTDYIDFMRESNGAYGEVGESPLQLWPVEDLVERNQGFGTHEFAPGLVLFGGNGGLEGYAFDTRRNPVRIVAVDYVSIGVEEDMWLCAYSFVEFLKFLYAQRYDES